MNSNSFEKNSIKPKDNDIIIEKLREIEMHIEIKPQKTLLVFDEIQGCPQALESLKYFCENAPETAEIVPKNGRNEREMEENLEKVTFLQLDKCGKMIFILDWYANCGGVFYPPLNKKERKVPCRGYAKPQEKAERAGRQSEAERQSNSKEGAEGRKSGCRQDQIQGA